MNSNIVRFCRACLVLTALVPLGIQFAPAISAPAVSGSYSVLQNKATGTQVQIRMRIHLKNNGSSDLSIQRLTLWDFSHPEKDDSRPCILTLRAHASADTTTEFILSHSDYERWQKGFRPRFVLDMAAGRAAAKNTAVIRLDRTLSREGK